MLDDMDDVMGVITEQIEARFGMSFLELQRAVTAAPHANREATEVVHWHGLLAESQRVLEEAEDNLVAVLETQPIELDDPAMEMAHRVNAAVSARNGRAGVVQWLLDPDAPGKKGLAAERAARFSRGARERPVGNHGLAAERLVARLSGGARQGPAVQTTMPSRPATAPEPVTRRGTLR